MDINSQMQKVTELIAQYGPQVLWAAITFFAGLLVIRILTGRISRTMEKRDFDPSLRTFASSTMSVTLKLLLIISVASMVGVATTSFVAVLGAASLAIGLAFQGTLSNFAASVLILTFRPFKVGDTLEADGHIGTVSEIQMFCTILKTLSNKNLIVPNSKLTSNTIINLSMQAERRVDLVFGIGYGDDLLKAKKVLQDIVASDSRVLAEPEASITVGELGDSSVNFYVRPWVNTADYWDVYFHLTETVKLRFDEEGISIPFPQRDIHVHQVTGN